MYKDAAEFLLDHKIYMYNPVQAKLISEVFNAALKGREPIDRWIPVEDPPQPTKGSVYSERVLTIDRFNQQITQNYNTEEEYWSQKRPTHWQPLPKGPGK